MGQTYGKKKQKVNYYQYVVDCNNRKLVVVDFLLSTSPTDRKRDVTAIAAAVLLTVHSLTPAIMLCLPLPFAAVT